MINLDFYFDGKLVRLSVSEEMLRAAINADEQDEEWAGVVKAAVQVRETKLSPVSLMPAFLDE